MAYYKSLLLLNKDLKVLKMLEKRLALTHFGQELELC
jgi:hypothetical protein